ncbi:hypothetical protein [Halococcus agarilyticus]|nr:hypothetical protein [Halococcus agarilyticus]
MAADADALVTLFGMPMLSRMSAEAAQGAASGAFVRRSCSTFS